MVIEAYLKENINSNVTINKWQDISKLPVFLENYYNYYEMTILDTSCILLEILDETPTVDVIEKHIKRIQELTSKNIVLYYREITRYRRKSLIDKRIPFIIEDGQMFMPFLGLDLKKTTQYKGEVLNTFSASAQLAYLYFLYNNDVEINATDFAKKIGLTVMTASRALNDLYKAKLITYKIGGKTGRSKEYKRIADPYYFKLGQVHIKSPVRKVVYVDVMPDNTLIAGLEALAQISMINPPKHPIRAISYEQIKKQELKVHKNKENFKEEALVELEIWNYDPALLTDNKCVDVMSLYESLKDEKDERVEQTLEDVLRDETWYMD